MDMSYRRAWLLVESLKQSFRESVTMATTGGKDGGGMLVTEFGDALIRNYRERIGSINRLLGACCVEGKHEVGPLVALLSDSIASRG
jgi:molybdate transport repressor ModE-like protein